MFCVVYNLVRPASISTAACVCGDPRFSSAGRRAAHPSVYLERVSQTLNRPGQIFIWCSLTLYPWLRVLKSAVGNRVTVEQNRIDYGRMLLRVLNVNGDFWIERDEWNGIYPESKWLLWVKQTQLCANFELSLKEIKAQLFWLKLNETDSSVLISDMIL